MVEPSISRTLRRRATSPKKLGKKLSFEHLEGRVVLATTTAIADGSWLDPAVWDNGVPTLSDDVVIPAARTIQLDGASHEAKTLLISGVLEAVENAVTDKTLVSEWIMVQGGLFRVGSAADRYDTNTLTVTLEGDDPTADFPSIGVMNNNAFLMSRGGGRIQLYGEEKLSWTQLGTTAFRGTTQITLKEPTDWTVGEQIVIASTSFDMNEAAVRTITGVQSGGTVIQFAEPLSRFHYGELQTYNRGDGTTYTLDERAEVGLLTRSIKIQGDADATTDGIGGHLMFMPSSGQIEIDSVELYHMGQKSQLGRYPVHWHLAGDRTGDFVKNSSIHRSFNRVITIHASHNILVERNVAYDHIGSGFFLENAVETGNKFYYNLGLVTREPVPGEELLPTDLGPKQFQISGPGTYWITNPDNEFVGNVAAGSQTGSGFWFALPSGPLNESANDPQYAGVNPRTVPLLRFEDNRAHSNSIGLDVDGGPDLVTQASVSTQYTPPQTAEFLRFTAFANDKNGVYFRGNGRLHLVDSLLGNNRTNVMYASNQKLIDSLMVGATANNFPGARRDGYAVYDGPGSVINTHFAGFEDPNSQVFRVIGAANRKTNHLFEDVTFDSASTPFKFDDTVPNNTLSRRWGFSIYDTDGTLTGTAGKSVVFDYPMMRSDGDTIPGGWENAVLTDREFAHLKLQHGLTAAEQPTVTFTRTKGPGADATFTDIPDTEPFTQLGVITNTDFEYLVTYDTPLNSNKIDVNVTGTLNPNDFVYLRVKYPWAGVNVADAVGLDSEQAVRDSAVDAYHINACGEVFIKNVGSGIIKLTEGDPLPTGPHRIIADFESGVDPRGALAQTQPGLRGTLQFDPDFEGEGVNYFEVFDNQNGNPSGFVDYQFSLDNPEDWRIYSELLIDFSSSHSIPIQAIVRDVTDGFQPLNGGTAFGPGANSLSLAGIDPNQLDEVDRLLIRVQESQLIAAGTTAATTYLKTIQGTLLNGGVLQPGDFDGSNLVDGADLAIWEAHYGTSLDATPCQGDADGDADVDGFDFLAWQRSHTTFAAASVTVAAAMSQEPELAPAQQETIEQQVSASSTLNEDNEAQSDSRSLVTSMPLLPRALTQAERTPLEEASMPSLPANTMILDLALNAMYGDEAALTDNDRGEDSWLADDSGKAATYPAPFQTVPEVSAAARTYSDSLPDSTLDVDRSNGWEDIAELGFDRELLFPWWSL